MDPIKSPDPTPAEDRRTFIAALVCASLAPQWQHRLLKETQDEAAQRLPAVPS